MCLEVGGDVTTTHLDRQSNEGELSRFLVALLFSRAVCLLKKHYSECSATYGSCLERC